LIELEKPESVKLNQPIQLNQPLSKKPQR